MTTKSKNSLFLRGIIWTYALFIAASWLFLYLGGDRWWPATLILFGPRWVFSIPLLLLVPLAALFSRRHLIVLGFAAAVLFIPFMGLCIPWKSQPSREPVIRVLSCNVGGPNLDEKKLLHLIKSSKSDVVALQDCKSKMMDAIPSELHSLHVGEFIIASHYPVKLRPTDNSLEKKHKWPRPYLLQCLIKTPLGEICVVAIHLPSPHNGLSGLLDRSKIIDLSRLNKLNSEKELRHQASREISQYLHKESLPLIIAGDFNMPVESVFYRRYWSNYNNAFSEAGFGYGLTMKALIQGFEHGIRIDHILTKGSLAADNCRVGDDIGSDHLPVIADIHSMQ